MSVGTVALLFALIAQGIAFTILLLARFEAVRGIALWMLMAVTMCLVVEPAVILLLMALLLLILAPAAAGQRVAFFIFAVPCLPDFVMWNVPFPGINFLAVLSPQRVAVLVLLVPLLFYPRSPNHPVKGWSPADFCIIGYAIFTAIIISGALNVTSGFRFFGEQLMMLVIPYMALVRAIDSDDAIDLCLRAFVASAIILAAIALVSTLKQWDFYRHLQPLSFFVIPDFRGGLMRISATANTHSLGFYMAAAIILIEHLKPRMKPGFLILMGIRGLLLLALIVTGSRGALVGLMLGLGVYVFFVAKHPAVRTIYMAAFVLGVVGSSIWLLSADLSEIDPYGTFDYRMQLLTTSFEYISDHFWIGDLGYLGSDRFAHLMQGQGIIDITNLYLQILLAYGVIGFVLLFGIFAQTMIGLLRAALIEARQKDGTRCAALLAVLVGWLALVATTSDVALTVYLGLFAAALGRVAYSTVRARDAAPMVSPQAFKPLYVAARP